MGVGRPDRRDGRTEEHRFTKQSRAGRPVNPLPLNALCRRGRPASSARKCEELRAVSLQPVVCRWWAGHGMIFVHSTVLVLTASPPIELSDKILPFCCLTYRSSSRHMNRKRHRVVADRPGGSSVARKQSTNDASGRTRRKQSRSRSGSDRLRRHPRMAITTGGGSSEALKTLKRGDFSVRLPVEESVVGAAIAEAFNDVADCWSTARRRPPGSPRSSARRGGSPSAPTSGRPPGRGRTGSTR